MANPKPKTKKRHGKTVGKISLKEGPPDIIATMDIETDKEGDLLDANLAFHTRDGELKYYTATSWPEFIDCVKDATQYNVWRIWAHNGGGFDYIDFMKLLIQKEFKDQAEYKSCKLISSSMLELKIGIAGLKRQISFADSARLLPTTLKDLTGPKGFNLDLPKMDVPKEFKENMGEYKRQFPEKYHLYHRTDTVALLECLEKFRDMVEEISGLQNLQLSIASTAMRVFRLKFIEYDIFTPGKDELAFQYEGYQGGRTEYVGDGGPDVGKNATYSCVHQWDSNSHYPAAMENMLFPVKPGIYVNKHSEMFGKDGLLHYGMYRARFEQRHGRIAIIKPKIDDVVSKQAIWEGEAIATHIELNAILRNGGKVTPSEGYIYPTQSLRPIFRRFVQELYAWRLHEKSVGNMAMVLVIKLLMNNLYGKFAERPISESFEILEGATLRAQLDASEKDPKNCKITLLERIAPNAYAVQRPRVVDHAFPAISAFITADGRMRLLDIANVHGIAIIYMDTDSIHTREEFPKQLRSETRLGFFKCETDKHPEGVTEIIGGRKCYVNMTEEKVKAKGVPSYSFEHRLMEIANGIETGQPFIANFRSPLKAKGAMKAAANHSANRFDEYTRTINRTPSTFEEGNLRNYPLASF